MDRPCTPGCMHVGPHSLQATQPPLTESPAKSLRPGATLGQSLRAKAAVSTPSAAHFHTQVSNRIMTILGIIAYLAL